MRNLDHLVLIANDLNQNRADLSALGFHVAADGIHPFGTKNACVFFQDGTYFEPVAIDNAALFEQAAHDGNAFVQKYQDYQRNMALKGFSGMALTSDDVQEDYDVFDSHQMLLGPTFSFSRGLKLPDGTQKQVSFHLNFVDNGDQDHFLGFAIVREVPLPTGQNELTMHPNGVIGIKSLLLQTKSPTDYLQYLSVLTGDHVPAQTDSTYQFQIGERDIILSEYYDGYEATQSLNGVAISLKVQDLNQTKAYLGSAQLAYVERDQHLLFKGKDVLGYDLLFSD